MQRCSKLCEIMSIVWNIFYSQLGNYFFLVRQKLLVRAGTIFSVRKCKYLFALQEKYMAVCRN